MCPLFIHSEPQKRDILFLTITLANLNQFWATVCKTVRPMLSVRCLSVCLSCLSVCPVCNVGVLWPNGWSDQDETCMQVGLGPGHIVLEGDPAPPPQRGTASQFSAHICCGQMAAWIKMSVGMKLGLGPGDFVLDGDHAPLPKRGRSPPNFRPSLLRPNG